MTARNYGVPHMDRLTNGGSISYPKPRRKRIRWVALGFLLAMVLGIAGVWV